MSRPILRNLLVAIGLLGSPVAAMDQVRVQKDGQELELQGEVIVEAQDGGLFVQDRAQVYWEVQPGELLGRESDDRPFAPLDHEALASELLQQLPAGFKTHKTTHYLICYNTSQPYAKWCGALFERLYKAFRNYWRKQGMTLQDPDWPLVAVIFNNRRDYADYAEVELPSTNQITGYYSLRTNRVATYDLTETDNRFRARSTQAVVKQILRQPEAERTVATIIHEATHQLAFNCGLQARFADIPLWVSEGIAIYFETPDLRNSRGWKSIGGVNQFRNPAFQRYLRSRPFDSLESLISGDDRFRDASTASTAYAEAWALNYYLLRTRPKDYRRYLEVLSQKKPLRYDKPEERAAKRLALFREVFGDDLRAFDSAFVKYMHRVR